MRMNFQVLAAGLLAPPLHAATPDAGQQALHVLNRIAYGPAPGDVARVAQMGVQRYIDSQLEPAALTYATALNDRLAGLALPNSSTGAALALLTELRRDARDDEPGAKQRRADGLKKWCGRPARRACCAPSTARASSRM